MSNYSRQNNTILKIVEAHPHINIKEISDKAKFKIPTISLATIYRNLDKLESHQKIQRIHINREFVLYEKNKGPHHHFICTKCNTISDLYDPQINVCTSCLSGQHDFTINHINMNIFGTCKKCSQTLSN
ncbi:hypothetical protein COV81_03775 [Candidatus Peregrinibacteria bacterium CG11_big_fil_rev_8_21_14_0_20_41_10]|nr:MAG: hypothetical protein COV81_03775 [Candidatus Peregrinibacteria bacterium CG11_big_fil_rev_8_21_14_0_20_41_10]PIZ73660.1 MAG: hypothetical protein COY06_05145 [Candidatus Peregrinibacteria bacterium CG_4_10_14_0_2_um_filter_41_8]PJC38391.1 MAG: hypothetical protein CO045_00505 [Candidatus Peregrinibacteria bacterium CG_4_9_14_0_2_um_filter_41_14]